MKTKKNNAILYILKKRIYFVHIHFMRSTNVSLTTNSWFFIFLKFVIDKPEY